MIKLTLPYPPSVNRLWRHVGKRVLVSKEGRQYRNRVWMELRMANIKPIEGPVSLEIILHPPDRRKRDLDNCLKSILDSLQHGGAYYDDNQVKKIDAEMCEPIKGGKLFLQIGRYRNANG